MMDPDTRCLLIEQVAHTLSLNLQPMLAKIVQASTRPSVLYRPTLRRSQPVTMFSGTVDPVGAASWVAEYNDVRGSGVSPEEAMADFDRIWRGKK